MVPADVADVGQVQAAARRVEDAPGPVRGRVSNAMAAVFARFQDTTALEFTRAAQLTYPGTVYGTMAAPEQMVPRDHRTVVQAGPALACRASPPRAAYCGAKSGIGGFTGSTRTGLIAGQSRAWITMVQLPGVNTPQFNWCDSKLPEASAFPFLLPASRPGVATHPSPALKLRQEPPA